MKNIVMVPAKGVSKRFPNKNWMTIGGETLFERALYRARRSGLGKVAFVSDSVQMLERIGKQSFLSDYLVELPEKFSEVRAVNSCVYALKRVMAQEKFDNIIVTLPTSPLATEVHLKETYDIFVDHNREVVGSFTSVKGSPLLWISAGNCIAPLRPLFPGENKSEKRMVWRNNGAVYISTVERFLKEQEWFDDLVIPYFMDEVSGIDIDIRLDYLMAKTIYETREVAD